jgi:predicted nucleic acid-binding protein
VLDASTAILLSKVDLLRIVVERVDTWMGGQAADEALAKGSDDAIAIATLIEEGRIRRISIEEDSRRLMRDFRLHAGEAEAVLLAKRKKSVCGTDDGRAIRCCKVLGVRFTTAIGLLVALTETGELEKSLAAELLEKLERFGRHHPRILEDGALRIRAAREGGENP